MYYPEIQSDEEPNTVITPTVITLQHSFPDDPKHYLNCFQDLQKSQNKVQTPWKHISLTLNSQLKGKYQHSHTHSKPKNHPSCLHHLHQLGKHSFQDHHHTATIDTSINNTFQDYRVQSTAINAHHYYLAHHRDHTHTLKDSVCHQYPYTCLC